MFSLGWWLVSVLVLLSLFLRSFPGCLNSVIGLDGLALHTARKSATELQALINLHQQQLNNGQRDRRVAA